MLALLLAAQAHAYIYTGNPDFGVEVNRLANDYVEGDVHLDKVRIVRCDASWTDYTVDGDVDVVAGFTLTVAGGDLCAAVFYWGSTMTIDGDGSLGAFTVSYDKATTTVLFDDPITPKALTPYTVTSGSMEGWGPWLVMTQI
ncbi:MAG: hypothetical protein H6735_26195 [Alphaproteobacteria bacterium]|nr:hypothetical protein [Alphaproteobacteria bacterium]